MLLCGRVPHCLLSTASPQSEVHRDPNISAHNLHVFVSGVVQIPVVFHSPQLFFAEIRTKYCLQRTECLSFIYRRSERMRVLFDTLSVLCDKEFNNFGSKLSVLPDLFELRCQWDVSEMSVWCQCACFVVWFYLAEDLFYDCICINILIWIFSPVCSSLLTW